MCEVQKPQLILLCESMVRCRN